MNIFLFGVQGSGKSTIGRYLAEKMDIPFIATGEIFRQLREENSELGRKIKDLIDEGNMVPDEITMELVNNRLAEKDTEKGFILDGAPRDTEQEKLMGKKPDLIIQVNLNEEKAIKRMLERGRVDDTEESIRKRLSWYKEKVEPVVEKYRKQGIKFIEVDNSGPIEEVQNKLDELFEN